MKIEHIRNADTLNIKLSGELDESCSDYVRAALDGLIDGEGIKRIVIDLSELAFMDSTGIGVLIGRYKRVKPRGIPIFIFEPTKAVDRVLDLSGIYEIMPKAV